MQTFTTEDADRLLGLADQFLEDWDEDLRLAAPNEERAEFTRRRTEWESIRPLLVEAPALLATLKDLRGNQPAVKNGECRWCGRNYASSGHDVQDGPCPADDCPTFKADAILAKINKITEAAI